MSGPLRKRRPAGVSAENRQNILDAALHLFAARGFDGVSIRDISDAADVYGATIYHHFGDKLGLYDLVTRDARDELMRQHLEVLEGPGEAAERLSGFLRNILR